MRIKTGWTVKGILGLAFTGMGLLFTALGWIIGTAPNITWEGNGGGELFLAIFCGIGGVILLTGLALLASDLRRRHLLQRAYNEGNRVDAEILGIRAQENAQVNGVNPRVLECAYTDDAGVVHVYRSRYLNIDVTKLLKSETVPVYIDRYDERIGYVDVDAVLPEIRIHG